ncbi:MAG: gas vesicle protein GvpG [Acidimicrobiales bacterium]
MGKRRATFGKLQRERDKKAKAAVKRERRIAGRDEPEDEAGLETTAEPQREYDEGRLLDALAALHQSYEAGTVSTDEFETRREELTSRLRVD